MSDVRGFGNFGAVLDGDLYSKRNEDDEETAEQLVPGRRLSDFYCSVRLLSHQEIVLFSRPH